MAKLPETFSILAVEIETMRRDGRGEQARRLVVDALVRGDANARIQRIAAEMLTPHKSDGKRGPKRKEPFRWSEIWDAFNDLVDDGISAGKAKDQIGEVFGRNRRSIDQIIDYAQQRMDDDSAEKAEEMGRMEEADRKRK